MRAVVLGFGIPAALILATVAVALLLGLVMQRRQDARAQRHAQRERARHAIEAYVIRRWQEQIPGLERIPACTDCRVVAGGADRVPCQWHADLASVAIERHVDA